MSDRTKWLLFFLFQVFGIMPLMGHAAFAPDSVTLYTPYTRISVPPGQSIDYSIEIINNSKSLQNFGISLSGVPKGWNCVLKFGAWNLNQLAILPGQKQNISLKVDVPQKVNKGTYRFRVVAGGSYSLPLAVTVSEQGTFESEFTAQQANMEGHSKSNFTFNTVVHNRTGEKQQYGLRATAPRGWTVTFKPNYIQATSVEVEPNTTKDVSIEIKPPESIEAGTYLIPVSAVTGTTSASLNLEVVITGTYSMELITPTGLLSADITAGDEKRLELLVRNTGSSIINGIELTSSVPVNWSVIFDPVKVERLDPGQSATVFATIKAYKKAIAGDYVTTLESRSPEASSTASFRISVKTPVLLGWIGILIIIGALGIVFYLFQKYGRR